MDAGARKAVVGADAGWAARTAAQRVDARGVDRRDALRARDWSIEARMRADGAEAMRRLSALGGLACRIALADGPRWMAVSEDGRPLHDFDADVMERLRRVGALAAQRFDFGGRLFRVSKAGELAIHRKSKPDDGVHSAL